MLCFFLYLQLHIHIYTNEITKYFCFENTPFKSASPKQQYPNIKNDCIYIMSPMPGSLGRPRISSGALHYPRWSRTSFPSSHQQLGAQRPWESPCSIFHGCREATWTIHHNSDPHRISDLCTWPPVE